eukprot:gene4221-14334_t
MLDTASVQRAKDFCEHRLLNDNWRATADDPYGQVEFVAAVARVFGTTDNRTLEASVPPRLSVEQLAFVIYRPVERALKMSMFIRVKRKKTTVCLQVEPTDTILE